MLPPVLLCNRCDFQTFSLFDMPLFRRILSNPAKDLNPRLILPNQLPSRRVPPGWFPGYKQIAPPHADNGTLAAKAIAWSG
jgi:hypothetical protein